MKHPAGSGGRHSILSGFVRKCQPQRRLLSTIWINGYIPFYYSTKNILGKVSLLHFTRSTTPRRIVDLRRCRLIPASVASIHLIRYTFLKRRNIMDAAKTGAFIAAMRRERNMTQAELAAVLHVTDKAVSKWERGAGLPDINLIEPLA